MAQYSFTSTETRRLIRTDSPGRPPRLSHSSFNKQEEGVRQDYFVKKEKILIIIKQCCFMNVVDSKVILEGGGGGGGRKGEM